MSESQRYPRRRSCQALQAFYIRSTSEHSLRPSLAFVQVCVRGDAVFSLEPDIPSTHGAMRSVAGAVNRCWPAGAATWRPLYSTSRLAAGICMPHWNALPLTRTGLQQCLAAQPAAAPAAAPSAALTDARLLQFIADKGVQASFVHDNHKPITDPDVIKSLVFMVHGTPLLLVVLGQQRVDERKVAMHLRVARRRVRLATEDECVQHSGFHPGTVPPFGHPTPLRTLVDVAVTQQQEVFGGGGHPDLHVRVSVAQLLHVVQAEVGLFAEQREGAALLLPAAADAAAAVLAAPMPLPWPAGSETVRLVGIVAQKRRIARLLQFVVLVPEDVPALPPGSQAAYLRRLWRHPEQGVPCEVQLIMGKTLERNLGREAALAVMDQVKVGAIISVSGRVQPHLGPQQQPTQQLTQQQPTQQPTQQQQQQQQQSEPYPNGLNAVSCSAEAAEGASNDGTTSSSDKSTATSSSSGSNARGSSDNGHGSATRGSSAGSSGSSSSSSSTVRPQVLDVVVHHLEVLYRNRDVLDRACLRAARQGFEGIQGAAQMEQLLRLGPQQFAASCHNLASSSLSSTEEDDCSVTNSSTTNSSTVSSLQPGTQLPQRASGYGVQPGNSANQSSSSSSSSLETDQTAVESVYWRLPLTSQQIHVVTDVDGVLRMQQHVFGSSGSDPTSTGSTNTSTCSSSTSGIQTGSSSTNSSYASGGSSPSTSSTTDSRSSGSSSAPQQPLRPAPHPWVAASSQPLLLAGAAAVGLDAEWVPCGRGAPKTPVAWLQLATRTAAFLVDMLTLTGTRRRTAAATPAGPAGSTDAAHAAVSTTAAAAGKTTGQQQQQVGAGSTSAAVAAPMQGVTPAVAALSAFLEQLLQSENVIKLGFYLNNDLSAGCRSLIPGYPASSATQQACPATTVWT